MVQTNIIIFRNNKSVQVPILKEKADSLPCKGKYYSAGFCNETEHNGHRELCAFESRPRCYAEDKPTFMDCQFYCRPHEGNGRCTEGSYCLAELGQECSTLEDLKAETEYMTKNVGG